MIDPQHPRSQVSEQIEEYASKIYLEDSTGENFIENVVHATNLPGLLRRIDPGALNEPILEMGFGEGTITEPLLHAGLKVEIVEGSSMLCNDAIERFGDKLKVHCSFFEQFNPVQKFRTILCLHVLEHVDSPSEVLEKMLGWLKPGGQIVVVVPNAESLHRQLAVMMGLQESNDTLSPRDKIVGHQRVLKLEQLIAHVEGAGFAISETFGYFLKIVPNSMMTTWPSSLIRSLTTISEALPPHLMSNIGLIATRK